MAPRIVSWSDNEFSISPVLSSAASIVSFDSTFSEIHPSQSKMSPTGASEVPELHSIDIGAKHTSPPGFSEGRNLSRDGHWHVTPDDSFVRHDVYFFKDGNVTFLIGGMLYCVHRYFFSRDSIYFSTRFAQLGIRNHEALHTIISIGDIERNDFEALLSILYPVNFEAHELSYEQWKSVLHLSTRWGFASLRKLALKSIEPSTPHDQLVLARTYSVDHWVLPALTALCERTPPLGLDEARQMSMEDVILVTTVREEIRGGALQVNAADILHHVEVAQAGKPNRPMGINICLERPKSGSTGQESDPTMTSGVDPDVKAGIAKTIGVASPSGPKQRATKEGETDESGVDRSSKEVPANAPGVEQPHLVESTAQDRLEKNAARSAMQTSGTRKLEGALPEAAAAWPPPQPALAKNSAVLTMKMVDARREADTELMRRFVAKAIAENEARMMQVEEAARAKQKADTEAQRAAIEAMRAEERTRHEAEASAKAEADAKVAVELKVKAAQAARQNWRRSEKPKTIS